MPSAQQPSNQEAGRSFELWSQGKGPGTSNPYYNPLTNEWGPEPPPAGVGTTRIGLSSGSGLQGGAGPANTSAAPGTTTSTDETDEGLIGSVMSALTAEDQAASEDPQVNEISNFTGLPPSVVASLMEGGATFEMAPADGGGHTYKMIVNGQEVDDLINPRPGGTVANELDEYQKSLDYSSEQDRKSTNDRQIQDLIRMIEEAAQSAPPQYSQEFVKAKQALIDRQAQESGNRSVRSALGTMGSAHYDPAQAGAVSGELYQQQQSAALAAKTAVDLEVMAQNKQMELAHWQRQWEAANATVQLLAGSQEAERARELALLMQQRSMQAQWELANMQARAAEAAQSASMWGSLAGVGGTILGSLLGGPIGGAIGGWLGGQAGSSLSGGSVSSGFAATGGPGTGWTGSYTPTSTGYSAYSYNPNAVSPL